MTTLELLAFPGMDSGTRQLKKLREESRSRLQDSARQQQMANALMAARSRRAKRS